MLFDHDDTGTRLQSRDHSPAFRRVGEFQKSIVHRPFRALRRSINRSSRVIRLIYPTGSHQQDTRAHLQGVSSKSWETRQCLPTRRLLSRQPSSSAPPRRLSQLIPVKTTRIMIDLWSQAARQAPPTATPRRRPAGIIPRTSKIRAARSASESQAAKRTPGATPPGVFQRHCAPVRLSRRARGPAKPRGIAGCRCGLGLHFMATNGAIPPRQLPAHEPRELAGTRGFAQGGEGDFLDLSKKPRKQTKPRRGMHCI
jgi:hypothetical protein